MIEIKNELTEYAEKFTSEESPVLRELREHCFAHYEDSSMLSGHVQGRILALISKMIRPKLVVEIGTYLGYSALCFAEGLANGGKVITLDIQEETNRVAKSFVERTEYKDAIDFRLGEAKDMIPQISDPIDLVFIDADKSDYSLYYDLVFEKVRKGGFIVADNVLWSGRVLNAEKDADTQALHDFNLKIQTDDRVSNVLLPIRDGLMIVCKS
ncbi:MAG: class I SAM-dependent methyltransferase [Acidobacteria bacterium]|nr:class I SAM-dependent methyltransferase [Acidobacteriota bacterium]